MADIVISGYYGFDNAGDEAVLFSIIQALRREHPGVRLVVLSHNPEQTRAAYGVEAVSRWDPVRVLKVLAGSDLLISGGGSLLQDVTGPRSLIYYLGIVRAAVFMKRPVVFYAQGVGPVTGRLGRWLVRRVANKVNLITVRDEPSRRALAEMGVTRPPVHVTADPVLGLDPQELDLEGGMVLLAGAGIPAPAKERIPRLAGVSLREWPGLRESLPVVAKACDRLVRQGWKIIFLPMQTPGDLAPCEEAAGLMEEKPVVLKNTGSIPQLMGLFGCLDLVIGMRLHALIMAVAAGVPVAGIAYDPKVTSFLQSMELPCAGQAASLSEAAIGKALDLALIDSRVIRERRVALLAQRRALARESSRLALGQLRRQ